MKREFREPLFVLLVYVWALVCVATAQQVVVQPAPVVFQPPPVVVPQPRVIVQPAPVAYYQPAMVYTPVWNSGPLGIIWWRTWQAQPVVPVQPQQLPPPQYQNQAPQR